MKHMRKRGAVAAVLVALLGIGLTACHSGDYAGAGAEVEQVELPPLSSLTPLEDPTAYEGPTTAIIGGPSIELPETTPKPELPVTVTSLDKGGDTEIVVEDVSRIVPLSLSGTVGEFVMAYGMADNIVGRDVSTSFPGADDVPVVTHAGHSVDAEAVLALNPSLILTDGTIGPTDVVLQLRDAGIPVVTVDRAKDAESSYVVAQQVADALGISEAAPPLVESMRSAVDAVEADVQNMLPADEGKLPRIAFLYVRGTAGIFYLFGEGSGADSLIKSIGAIDVAEEVGWVGERPMTEEALIAMDPDIILVMTQGLTSANGVDGLLAAQPSIALTSAGENRRIIDVDDTLVFAGGTRTPDVIDGLARAVYAPDSLEGLAQRSE